MSGSDFSAVAGTLTSLAAISTLLSAAAFADGCSINPPGSARAEFGLATMLYGAVAGAIYARIALPSRP